MIKQDIKELFEEQLKELSEFENDVRDVKKRINNIIDNLDLLKNDITDEEILNVFSQMNIKTSKLKSDIDDITSDSKKLQSFLDELKLLKRKRENKLKKEKEDNIELDNAKKRQRMLDICLIKSIL